jgi:hypothetical protein
VQFGNVHFLFSAEVFSILLIVTPVVNSLGKYEKAPSRPGFAFGCAEASE